MTGLEKAIYTLQELPSNNLTGEELTIEKATFPNVVQLAAREEVVRVMNETPQELSSYGFLKEQVLCCRRIMEVVLILNRAGFKVTGA